MPHSQINMALPKDHSEWRTKSVKTTGGNYFCNRKLAGRWYAAPPTRTSNCCLDCK